MTARCCFPVVTMSPFDHIIQIFSSDLRNFPLLLALEDFFCQGSTPLHPKRTNGMRSTSVIDSGILSLEEPFLTSPDGFFLKPSKNHKYEDGDDPNFVFNVLDSVMVGTMERLKNLRESIFFVGKCNVHGGVASNLNINHNFKQASDTVCLLIRSFCINGKVGDALQLHSKLLTIHTSPDLHTYNILMNALCKINDLWTAAWLLDVMPKVGVSPNSVTYNTLIDGYCRSENADKALHLFSSMYHNGVKANIVTCNILVHALCKEGHLDRAKKLLDEILYQNIDANLITSTIFINGSCRGGNLEHALELWHNMLRKGLRADHVAYNVLINGFSLVQKTQLSYTYICDMCKRGFLPDIVTFNTLITGHFKEGDIEEACDMHRLMPLFGVVADNISYRLLIRGLYLHNAQFKSFEYLQKMLNDEMVPEPQIWNLIMNGYAKYGDIDRANLLKNMMMSSGVLPNTYTYNALILAEVKGGKLAGATSLKEEMVSRGQFPDVVTYNLLIRAACNIGYTDYANKLIHEMLNRGYKPDIITHTELIRGHCLKGEMKKAEYVLGKIERMLYLSLDHVPFQIIIKQYCKMGNAMEAYQVYENMSSKGLVGSHSMYHSLLTELRKGGYHHAVDQVYDKMNSLVLQGARELG
ncbi:Pentatricopeptide repeat-containing protein [Platanthera guangdongensis]|uniref:Pentatricopeptide repeat-containing protein n=1 Tax=Platanthera guangdongensis TaxID=2320717 RepID=A0ABR2LZ97_9ASPA